MDLCRGRTPSEVLFVRRPSASFFQHVARLLPGRAEPLPVYLSRWFARFWGHLTAIFRAALLLLSMLYRSESRILWRYRCAFTGHLTGHFQRETKSVSFQELSARCVFAALTYLRGTNRLITLRASCGAVYCNRSCLCVWVVAVFVGLLPR